MSAPAREALYYQSANDQNVQCRLCPKNCVIAPGAVGFCRARENQDGRLYSLVYGKTTGIALDPIEKKPLYHYHPGEFILSLGTRGCNFRCIFCQNWHISQDPQAYIQEITSAEVIAQAKLNRAFGIAYTYNEPFIWYEFVLETAKKAKTAGLENVLVTNGYVQAAPLDEILPFISAMNIDLKAMDEGFYRNVCKGELAPVLKTIVRAKQSAHIELTNLVIPTLNDSDAHFNALADWIMNNTGADTPLHLSRYFPCFELNLPATPRETLERALVIARKKLKYVYLGNV